MGDESDQVLAEMVEDLIREYGIEEAGEDLVHRHFNDGELNIEQSIRGKEFSEGFAEYEELDDYEATRNRQYVYFKGVCVYAAEIECDIDKDFDGGGPYVGIIRRVVLNKPGEWRECLNKLYNSYLAVFKEHAILEKEERDRRNGQMVLPFTS